MIVQLHGQLPHKAYAPNSGQMEGRKQCPSVKSTDDEMLDAMFTVLHPHNENVMSGYLGSKELDQPERTVATVGLSKEAYGHACAIVGAWQENGITRDNLGRL